MVPGTFCTTRSISLGEPLDLGRSGPKTLTPTGVRMPVDSMSMRALIGMVQALLTPGRRSASSISAMQLSIVMPGRHSLSGFRLMTVSNISTGAGSVAVLARPALPKTEATSGKDLMIRSWVCRSSAALVTERPGQGDRHIEQRAFIEGRHEFAAEPRDGPGCRGQREHGNEDGQNRRAQHGADHRPVKPDEHAG